MLTFRISAFAVLSALALFAVASPQPARAALASPETFIRDLDAAGAPVGDWQPLAGAQLHSVFGEQVGVRLQASGQPGNAQRFLPVMTSVPDGSPDQPDLYAACPIHEGNVGDIVALDAHVDYEGDGAYTLSVTATTGTTSGTGCAAGPATAGTFASSAPASLSFTGAPLLDAIDENFVEGGATVTAPLGSSVADVLCARDAVRQADGSLTGPGAHSVQASPSGVVPDSSLFTEPGNWSCAVRGRAVNPGPWSEPVQTVVQADYRGLQPPLKLADRIGPRYRYSARAFPVVAGATITMEAALKTGCTRRGKLILKRSGRRRATAREGPTGAVSFVFSLPPAPASGAPVYYLLSSTLGGTAFVHGETVADYGLQLQRTGGRTVGTLLAGIC